jgi:D-lactate dehydrogenase (cytochrome)
VTGDGEEQLMAWIELFQKFNFMEDWSAMTAKDRERLRLFRHSLPENVNETMRQRGMKKMGMDLAVPDEKLDELMKIYREEGAACGSDYVLFGHVGDNNLHLNFLPKKEEEMDCVRATYLSIAGKAIKMGGTISAEHGVGKKQFPVNGQMTPYLGLMYNEDELRSIGKVKKALDPRFVLNRGNMIPESYLK